MNLSELQSALAVMGKRLNDMDSAADVIHTQLKALEDMDLTAIRDGQIQLGIDPALARQQRERMMDFRSDMRKRFSDMSAELDCMRSQRGTMEYEVQEAIRRNRARV